MAELDAIRKELEKLLKEVSTLQAQAAGPTVSEASATSAPKPAEEAAEDGVDAIRELQQYLASKTGEAEDALEEHPLVAMAAAFLLGVVAGRIAFR